MNRVLKSILSLLLACLMLATPFVAFAARKAPEGLTEEEYQKWLKREEMLKLMEAINYRTYRDQWGDSVANITSEDLIAAGFTQVDEDGNTYGAIRLEAADYSADQTTALVFELQDHQGMDGISLVIGESGDVTWEVDVPKTAMYAVRFCYTSVADVVEEALKEHINDGGTPEDTSDDVPIIRSYGTSAQRGLKVDGEFPFKESRYLEFPRTWQDDYYYGEDGNRCFRADESSDSELRPTKSQVPLWETIYATDSTGYYLQEFTYYLTSTEENEGLKHTLTLTEVQEALVLRYIELVPIRTIPSYKEVAEGYKANGYTAPDIAPENYPKFQAEYPDYVSAQTVYAVNDRTSAITEPQDPATLMLNSLGGEKWNTVGQWVEWTMSVPESGLYYITPRTIQNVYDGVYSSRALSIDGEIPFAEAGYLQFTYSNEWKLGPLSLPDGTPLAFYLTEGEHKIRLNVVLGEMGEVLAQAEAVMNTMNGYYLEILKLTGPTPDTYRDYEFSKLMPEVLQGMLDLSKELYGIADQLREINGYTGEKIVTLEEIAFLLDTLGGDEYQIAENFSNLNDQVSALGTWITDTRYQPLQIDYFLLTPASDDVVLPPAEATAWESLVFEFKSFLVSFTTDYNSMAQGEDEVTATAVEVWMTTGRDQAQIIRSMVNDLFTAETGIPINLKLVAGGQLQAVLAGVGPDIDLQEGEDGVISWAIRNANIPIQELPGFEEVTKRFTRSAMVPLTLYGKAYALPYTQSFNVLFYREDVLASLGIDPPETWDEIYDIIPVLQQNNMQMAVPTGSSDYVYQRFAAEENYRIGNQNPEGVFGENSQYPGVPLSDAAAEAAKDVPYNDEYGTGYLYENGYKPGALVDDAIYVMPSGIEFNLTYGMQVNLDGENSLDCFKKMCEFFTLYSFPRVFNFQNRFRTGEMPLGVQGYSLYGTLMVIAPELRGLWSFTVMPGTINYDDEGNAFLNHRTASTIGAIQMLRGCGTSNEDPHRLNAWEFMKFWCDAPAQERYGNELLALLGASGRHATANLEALESQPWPAEDRAALKECFEWVMTTYNMPGGYISARYVGFAYNNAYNDAAAPIPAMLEYIDQINAELTRKRREFDLPTLDNYKEFDYEAYYAEHYKIENENGGYILEETPTI